MVFNIVSTHPEITKKEESFEAFKFVRFTKQWFLYFKFSSFFNQIPNFFFQLHKNGTEI